jgi:MFS family permease
MTTPLPPDDSDLSADTPNADPVAQENALNAASQLDTGHRPLDTSPHDPYVSLRFPNYRRYLAGQAVAILGGQMASVAVMWEIYDRTRSKTALGLVGLVQIIPIFALFLPAGHAVDRFNRRTIILISQFALSLAFAVLAAASLLRTAIPPTPVLDHANIFLNSVALHFGERTGHFSDRNIPILFTILLLQGVIRSFNQPAKSSLLPMLVPAHAFANAATWNSSVFETCTVAGPMLAGGLIALIDRLTPNSPWLYASIYLIASATALIQLLFFLGIRLEYVARPREPVTLRTLSAGIRWVFANKIIYSAITLDMFAVLLGGAVALLPVYAMDILQVGPVGFAALRAAPSIGAITMALFTAHRAPLKSPGKALLTAVAGFGIATIAFGLSGNFLLSLAALFLTGMFDNVSVVVRQSLVQILTPDSMRGRVSSVNAVFISSSNELGAFESGSVAALGERFFGAGGGVLFSVIAGGIGTIAVAAVVALKYPVLRKLAPLHQLSTAEAPVAGPFPVIPLSPTPPQTPASSSAESSPCHDSHTPTPAESSASASPPRASRSTRSPNP